MYPAHHASRITHRKVDTFTRDASRVTRHYSMQFDIFINPPDNPGEKWKAFSVAFPGCKGTGDTEEEAIKNFKISLDKCINALINILPEENNRIL